MGRPEKLKSRYHPSCPIGPLCGQANKPACPDNGGNPVRGWQGRSPSHRACLKVTAPAAPYRACILPGLLQRYDAGTLFRTAFVPYNVPQCGGFVKGGCANLSGP